MNHKLLSALVLAGTAMVAQVAVAHDGVISFNGHVVAQTCAINGNGTGNNDFLVTLPTVSTSALKAAGEAAGRKRFSIALSGCNPPSGTVHTYFEPGPTTDSTTGNLKLAAGGATNVQIGLLNQDFTPIRVGFADTAQNSLSAAISGGSALLEYYAEYVAIGTAGAGAANSSVMYTLAYL
jgi:major type 1 subunit fimbrin (pilin)